MHRENVQLPGCFCWQGGGRKFGKKARVYGLSQKWHGGLRFTEYPTMFSIATSARDVPRLIRDDVSKQVNAIVACNSFKMSPVTFIKRFGRVFFDLAMAVEFALGRGDSAAKNRSDAHDKASTFSTQ